MEIIAISNKDSLAKAIEVLSAGGLIIYPTETAYGVGADATNPKAVERLLKYKKRPEGKAISIACSNSDMAKEYVDLNDTAKSLYKQFLPGPLTVISTSKGNVDQRLEAENKTIGVRIPNYPFILRLIAKFGKPITATSANQSGKKTPYSIEDIQEANAKVGEQIDLFLDAGILPKRLTSTVVDTTSTALQTYRQGSLIPQKDEPKKIIITKSVEETITLGFRLMQESKKILKQKPVIFLLKGQLGAGKTHFTKGIAQSLGISAVIKSPTYSYVEEYDFAAAGQKNKLYHIDAWRVTSKQDLDFLGFKDWVKPGNVLVIEWPEVIFNLGVELDERKTQVIELDIRQGNTQNQREVYVY